MEGVGLIHSEEHNLQRCPTQISESYNNSQLYPEGNGKLVKIFEDKVGWEGRGENGRKERMEEMERIVVENRKQE